jgi:PAS domain S-box-containing protein
LATDNRGQDRVAANSAGQITTMNNAEFQLRAAGDPRLAVHAASLFPAWLWSIDGTRVLWANPVGARVFGAEDAASLASRTFGPADSRRRQIAHLAHRLPPSGAIRLERLRGFGAPLGTLMTCGCSRLDFADGMEGVLIVAAEPVGRAMPIAPGATLPVHVVHDVADRASPAPPAMAAERATQNVAAPGDLPTVEYERATISGEAPAEFALIDEFADTPEIAATDSANTPHDEPACAKGTKAATEPGASRTHPLRVSWQMDAQGRFSLGPDEFSRLIGVRGAGGFSRPWREIADTMGLDPERRVEKAIAARENLAGIAVNWPVDGGNRLRIELSGSPILDATQRFVGYRGFGICRDLDGLARLEEMRRHDFSSAPPSPGPISGSISTPVPPGSLAAEIAKILPAADLSAAFVGVRPSGAGLPPAGPQTSTRADLDTPVETPDEAPDEALKNVVPFRPIGEARTPALTAVENSAFNELARQLSARLGGESGTQAATSTTETGAEPPAAPELPQKKSEPPSWLTRPEPPAQGESVRDRMLLDLLPDGVLIYRLDRLLYANPAFLEHIGYASLHALEQAGGLDALYVAPGVSSASSTSDTGTPVTISAHQDSSEANPAIDATLHAINWDQETAHALIFSAAATREDRTPASSPPSPVSEPSTVGHANAEELGAILDTAADGIVMFDAEGNLNSCNRSAEALFGYDGAELVQRNLVGLFAPESQGAVLDYLASLKRAGLASLLEHGREVLGRVRSGGLIPLSITMGRTQLHGPNFFAVFRDLSQARKSESELRDARRLADRAAEAKADLLARISHEIRSPLNAIIGFAEVMIGERFGALGNERYLEYMKDIRASGERVVAIIDELTDLSRIETGKLDLSFTKVNLNDLVESCVALLQGEANRERIIIRTSLAHMLPPVVADARALRQIALNLIANSIHLANAGGQVIVSTALTDFGDVVLRVRDTGNGLNDDEVAAAMEPFRTQGPSDQAGEGSPVSLSLTKALVEANRAQFHLRTAARSGTLVEVVFSTAMAST